MSGWSGFIATCKTEGVFFFEKKVAAQFLPPPLLPPPPGGGGGGGGPVPRRKADREVRKHFFFEKKQQKTFDYFGSGSRGETEVEFAKFFASFVQKRSPSHGR